MNMGLHSIAQKHKAVLKCNSLVSWWVLPSSGGVILRDWEFGAVAAPGRQGHF